MPTISKLSVPDTTQVPPPLFNVVIFVPGAAGLSHALTRSRLSKGSIQQLYTSFVDFCTEADAGRNLRQFDLQAFG